MDTNNQLARSALQHLIEAESDLKLLLDGLRNCSDSELKFLDEQLILTGIEECRASLVTAEAALVDALGTVKRHYQGRLPEPDRTVAYAI